MKTKKFQLKVSKYVNINFIFGKILVKIQLVNVLNSDFFYYFVLEKKASELNQSA